MSKHLLIASLAMTALCVSVIAESAEEKAKEFSAKCIVSGKPAKEASFVKYKGKKLYFCCKNCPTAYKKSPKKFTAKANHQLLSTKQISLVGCPITGKPLNAETAIDVKGVKVAFCCKNCKGKAEKAGDGAIELVFAKFDKGFTLQTACPVSGKPIKADKVVEHKGKKVYFCCPNCPGAFEKTPGKFLAKLPQFTAEKKRLNLNRNK